MYLNFYVTLKRHWGKIFYKNEPMLSLSKYKTNFLKVKKSLPVMVKEWLHTDHEQSLFFHQSNNIDCIWLNFYHQDFETGIWLLKQDVLPSDLLQKQWKNLERLEIRMESIFILLRTGLTENLKLSYRGRQKVFGAFYNIFGSTAKKQIMMQHCLPIYSKNVLK